MSHPYVINVLMLLNDQHLFSISTAVATILGNESSWMINEHVQQFIKAPPFYISNLIYILFISDNAAHNVTLSL